MQKVSSLFLVYIITIAFLCSFISFHVLSVNAFGENWLSGWGYRKYHNMTSATGAGTNYQIQLNVYYDSGNDWESNVYLDSHSQTDFDDVRFTDDDGSTLLDYWLQSKTDSTSAIFWVEVRDSLESVTQTIYIYYGNSTVSSMSNGAATFVYFDDFSGDLSKWTSIAGTWSSTGGILNCTAGATSNGMYFTSSTIQSFAIDMISVIPSSADAAHSMGLYLRGDGTLAATNVYIRDYWHLSSNQWQMKTGSTIMATNATSPEGTTGLLSIRVYNSSSTNSTYLSYWNEQITMNVSNGNYGTNNGKVGVHTYAVTTNKYADDWRTRKYVYPEPVHSTWGTEEAFSQAQDLTFPLSQNINASSTVAKSMELAQYFSQAFSAFIGLFQWKASNFQIIASPNLYESSNMMKALGLLAGEILGAFASLTKGLELNFQPASSLIPSSNNYMQKALLFESAGHVKLFDWAVMGKENGFLGFIELRVSDFGSTLKGLGFHVTDIGRVFDYGTMLKAVGFQVSVFESTNSVYPFGYVAMFKAVGLLTVGTFDFFDSEVMLNAHGFLTNVAVNAYSTMLRNVELGFTSADIIHIPVYGTSGKETATILYEVSDLTKLFSNLYSNLEKRFTNYDLIYPSGIFVSNKGVQFSIYGLARLFRDVSQSIGKGFNTYETIKPLAFLNINKELQFSLYDLSVFFDNLSMGKSIRITFFELSELVYPSASVLTILPVTLVTSTSNMTLYLGVFAVIMSIVMSFVVMRFRSDED